VTGQVRAEGEQLADGVIPLTWVPGSA
jgi:hypothetical protein